MMGDLLKERVSGGGGGVVVVVVVVGWGRREGVLADNIY